MSRAKRKNHPQTVPLSLTIFIDLMDLMDYFTFLAHRRTVHIVHVVHPVHPMPVCAKNERKNLKKT